MTHLPYRALLLLAALVPALLFPLACKKRYEPRAIEWRIEPGKTLRLESRIKGNLTINSHLYKGAIPEIITYGVQSSAEPAVERLPSGAWRVNAESAELYIADDQRLELEGAVVGVLKMVNHKAPIAIEGTYDNVMLRNLKGGLRITNGSGSFQYVRVENLKGDLELTGGGAGRIDASNIQGAVHASDLGAELSVSFLSGECIGRGLHGGVELYNLNGTTSVSCEGDLRLEDFDLATNQRVELKPRPGAERELAAKGKDVAIRTAARATLKGIAARTIRVEARSLELERIAALKTELQGAWGCSISFCDSPLRMTQCHSGVLYLAGDYELTRCTALTLDQAPGAERLPGRRLLKDCSEIVCWHVAPTSVTQENCNGVFFPK